VGSGAEPGKSWILSIFGRHQSRQSSLSDSVLFDAAPVTQYVLNEGAHNKLNSMDSVLVDIENVVIMWSLWLIWNQAKCQRDLFLNVFGNQSSHFDQPVLAYKSWCRDILYNISGLI